MPTDVIGLVALLCVACWFVFRKRPRRGGPYDKIVKPERLAQALGVRRDL